MTNIFSNKINSSIEPIKETALWVALITPYDQQGDIDFDTLAEIANAQAAANNGMLLLGSTGEGLALSADEKRSIVDFICNLQLSTPIMVAVGGFDLEEQLRWIEECNDKSIDAYLLATPLYAKPKPVGQFNWFDTLLNVSEKPCMLYNVPSRSGAEIPVETLQKLQSHNNCWALKEASGDLNQFLNYHLECPDVEIFSGEDAMLPHLVSAGAKGLVSVCANASPEATNRNVELSLNNESYGLFPLWQIAVDSLFSVANPIPVNALMHLNGDIQTNTLRAPLTHQELTADDLIVAANNQINQWLVAQQHSHAVGE